MFSGEYYNTIDGKYRLIIPAKFRDELGRKCMLTKSNDNCLYLFTQEEWERHASQLLSLPTGNEEARRRIRKFTANAVEAEVDAQYRITIPQKLRDLVGIRKDVVTVGFINKIEIWDRDEYEKAISLPDTGEYEYV
jgi:MraZ protein